MEKNGVNLEIIRQDWLTEIRNMQMKFIEEFDPISIINTTDLFNEAANQEVYANFDFSQEI